MSLKDLQILDQPRHAARVELTLLAGMPVALAYVPRKGVKKGCLIIEWWAADGKTLSLNAGQVATLLMAAGLTVVDKSQGYAWWREGEQDKPISIIITLKGVSKLKPGELTGRPS